MSTEHDTTSSAPISDVDSLFRLLEEAGNNTSFLAMRTVESPHEDIVTQNYSLDDLLSTYVKLAKVSCADKKIFAKFYHGLYRWILNEIKRTGGSIAILDDFLSRQQQQNNLVDFPDRHIMSLLKLAYLLEIGAHWTDEKDTELSCLKSTDVTRPLCDGLYQLVSAMVLFSRRRYDEAFYKYVLLAHDYGVYADQLSLSALLAKPGRRRVNAIELINLTEHPDVCGAFRPFLAILRCDSITKIPSKEAETFMDHAKHTVTQFDEGLRDDILRSIARSNVLVVSQLFSSIRFERLRQISKANECHVAKIEDLCVEMIVDGTLTNASIDEVNQCIYFESASINGGRLYETQGEQSTTDEDIQQLCTNINEICAAINDRHQI